MVKQAGILLDLLIDALLWILELQQMSEESFWTFSSGWMGQCDKQPHMDVRTIREVKVFPCK